MFRKPNFSMLMFFLIFWGGYFYLSSVPCFETIFGNAFLKIPLTGFLCRAATYSICLCIALCPWLPGMSGLKGSKWKEIIKEGN